MCGIAGMVGTGANAALVIRMNVAHPDGDSLWSARGIPMGGQPLKITRKIENFAANVNTNNCHLQTLN